MKGTITHRVISSDRNVFCTLGKGGTTAGSIAPGAFLVTPPSGRGLVIPVFFHYKFFLVVICPRPLLGQNNTCRQLRSFRVYSPEIS